MDTSSTPTEGSLDLNQAGSAFAAMFDPVEPKEEAKAEPEGAEPAKDEPEVPAEDNKQEEGDDAPSEPESETVTVLVDGKPVELTKEQIAEALKGGLRQDDYTRKTQELAAQRKAAEAETSKAREERRQYAEGLQRQNAMLEGALQQQQNIDWAALLKADPVEYLEQKRIAEERQAQWHQNARELDQVQAQTKADFAEAREKFKMDQRDLLLAKIPSWKDDATRTKEATEIHSYCLAMGYTKDELENLFDHRAVINLRKAMAFDKMMAKASVAEKKIQATPQRVERPSTGTAGLDKRTTAFQRLSKSGSVEDAAAVFAQNFV